MECPANKCITDETWKIVDYRTNLPRKGMLSQTAVRNLGQKINVKC
jgi:hypothetical protein